MRTRLTRLLLGGALLVAGAGEVFAGAPAGFAVKGADVQVRRSGDAAEVRIVYDLSVHEAACGWFLADFEGLPAGAQEPKAVLLFDGKEFPAKVQEHGTRRMVQAFQDAKLEGRRVLEGSKSVQLALTFPSAACQGAEMTVAIPMPRSYVHREATKEDAKRGIARVTVRFDAESADASAEVRATFRAVPAGARLVLRSDARSAGASLQP